MLLLLLSMSFAYFYTIDTQCENVSHFGILIHMTLNYSEKIKIKNL